MTGICTEGIEKEIGTSEPSIDSGKPTKIDIQNYDFGAHLRKQIGPPPENMFDPHAHHILFKSGLGESQKVLVALGQSLLKQYGLDPILGLENLVWAPNRVKGQHGIEALRSVVQALKDADENAGTKSAMIKALQKQGEVAARREK